MDGHLPSGTTGDQAAGEDTAVSVCVESTIRSRSVGVVFQPIVDLLDGTIAAYEALARPRGGWEGLSVDRFFDAAQRAGLLWALESVTRAAAINAAANWSADIKLFINTSPEVFAHPRFNQALLAELAGSSGLTPERMVLEITEMAQPMPDDTLSEHVRAAKAQGFQIAVDDAGAGTSGLNRMMVLRPQWVKLDRNIVKGIEDDQLRQNLIRFFVYFARLSGVSVVAEGIELASELSVLSGLGVRFAQGYFLGMPENRAATMSPRFAAEVRDRWAGAQPAPAENPEAAPLADLCRPVVVLTAGRSAAEAAAELEGATGAIGVVTIAGRCPVGWAARAGVLKMAKEEPGMDVAQLTRPIFCPIPANATVQEALHMICLRDEHDLVEPLIVVDGSEIVGAMRLREMLRAVANAWRSGRPHNSGGP